ncbi:putative quinol monooxygenase [Caulobacter mirabilis]|uniref:Antibiotic biosynthesis monooxygenase n=1 Tax=Caulobacter mirabilis TaxID=69666 RepID=A0A2D2B0U7_9CAUL|nr:putative quinol monooxygenase [Caulobacter mirabilis]ATQ43881.1 antibiotic biosynthesis monooxygenase [Caulobacter mirabilis]
MSITYVIGFQVRPQQFERFRSLLDGVLDAMRHEPMFVSATLHRAPEDPCRLMLHETWADHQDVLDVQLKRPYRTAWHEALEEVLEGPRKIEVWEPLRSDGRGAFDLVAKSPPTSEASFQHQTNASA